MFQLDKTKSTRQGKANIMTITILDGGMGQELVARSPNPPTGLWASQALLDHPEIVRAVHRDYFAAGAEIATVDSYALHHDRLAPFGVGDQFEELHHRACQIAVETRDEHGSGLVAGSFGPIGWSYRPDLAPPSDQAAELYAEIARLQEPYIDLVLIETAASVDQARGAIMGAKVINKPIWVGISVDDENGTAFRSGEPVMDIVALVDAFDVDAVLINCSIPEAVTQAISLLADPLKQRNVPIGGYANGFTKISQAFKAKSSTVESLESRTDLGPERYADFAEGWVNDGATIVGGCCEVGPAHIAELAVRFK